MFRRFRLAVLALVWVFAVTLLPSIARDPLARAEGETRHYLPLMLRNAQQPPTLDPIYNTDHDNRYPVTWQSGSSGQQYILEEAGDPVFSTAVVVYQGSGLSWYTGDAGRYPGDHYYRVAAVTPDGRTGWSNTQAVTIDPLYYGLKVRWDGPGAIRGSQAIDMGYHLSVNCNDISERGNMYCQWAEDYNPDPLNFGPSGWGDIYNMNQDDPTIRERDYSSVLWTYPWIRGYDTQYVDGATVEIDRYKFTVTGPHHGVTTYGAEITYWEFVNQGNIPFYNDYSSGIYQVIRVGDAVLRYDAGPSHLLIYDSVKRTFYDNSVATAETVQYITQLTSATSLPGSPPFSFQSALEPDKAAGQPVENRFQKRIPRD